MVSLDALLLLAKLEYATGDYNAALTKLNNAGLDKLHEKPLTIRSLKIIAESFAIKGLFWPYSIIIANNIRSLKIIAESFAIKGLFWPYSIIIASNIRSLKIIAESFAIKGLFWPYSIIIANNIRSWKLLLNLLQLIMHPRPPGRHIGIDG